MFFKSKYCSRPKEIEKILEQIIIDNKIYYSVLLKGEKKTKVIEENLIFSKKEINDEFNKQFLNLKRKNISMNRKDIKKKEMKEIVVKNEKIENNEKKSKNKIINFKKGKSKPVHNYLNKLELNEQVFLSQDNRKLNNRLKENENFTEIKYEKGNLENDEPLKIVNVGRINKNDKSLYCEVEWKISEKGIQKDNTLIKTKDFLIYYPKLLIDYYESKIIFMQEWEN